MDDGSRDGTYRALKNLKDPRVKVFKNTKNMGAAYSRHKLMQEVDPSSILVFLDLDDYLPARCLQKLREPYSRGKLATCGHYRMTTKSVPKTAIYSYNQINRNTFYSTSFRWPPLRTFHGSLLSCLREELYKIGGKWVKTATDVALFWQILREIRHDQLYEFNEVMYNYRDRKSLSSKRMSKKEVVQGLRRVHEQYFSGNA